MAKIDILKTFKKMTLDEKREMLENIIMSDTLIFNYEHKTLLEGCHVGHVCINGESIQLTIHRESNIETDREKYRLDGYGGVLEFDEKLDAYIFIGKLNNQTFDEFVEEYEFDGDIKEYKEWKKTQTGGLK